MFLPWHFQRRNFLLSPSPSALAWGSSFIWTLPWNALVQLDFGKRARLEVSGHSWFAAEASRGLTVDGKASPEHPCSCGIVNQKVRKRKLWRRRKHFSDLVFLQTTFVWKSLFNVKRLLNCRCPLPSLQGFFCSNDAASGRLRGRVAAALYQISWMLWITGLESNLNWTSLVAAGMSQLRAPQCCSL